jgi:radical SAM superfamily enzyme YgiQ (UPF0313 family)
VSDGDFSLSKGEYDAVLYSSFTSQLCKVNKLIYEAKKLKVAKRYIVGGPGVTADPEFAASIVSEADVLFAGDGENLTQDIIFDGDKIVDTRDSPFTFWNHKTAFWNLINYQKYTKTCGLAVESSRGCPFQCRMCTAHMIHGRQYRARKPETVVEEIQFLQQKYRCNKFYFTDDNITANPKRFRKLMEQLSYSVKDASFSVPEGIQAHNLDYYTLKLMKKAGLKRFTIGAESGVQRVLDDVIGKGGLTVDRVEQVIRDSKQLGLKPSCFFVVGFPGETLAEAEQTTMFAAKLRKLGAVSCIVRNFIPMPGTAMHRECVEKNYLTVPPEKLKDIDFTHSGKHLVETPDFKASQIEWLVSGAQSADKTHTTPALWKRMGKKVLKTLKLR